VRDHAGGQPVIRDYDLHPPDDLRLFPVPKAGVLRFDDEVLVAQIRHGDIVVRHYAWRDHWFKINCTTDLRAPVRRYDPARGRSAVHVQLRYRHGDAAPRMRSSRSICGWTCSRAATA
jgi:hypothetical protein